MRAVNLRLWKGGCIFLCLFITRRRLKKRVRWTYSLTCKPASRRSLSTFLAMSTVPGNMTACGFPTANGAGFPVGSADTARWTTSSKSRAALLWRPWRPSSAGRPSRRRPVRTPQRRKCPSACFCRRPPRITGPCSNILWAGALTGRFWTTALRPGGFMRAGTRATATWFLWALTKPGKHGSAACGGLAKPGSTGM